MTKTHPREKEGALWPNAVGARSNLGRLTDLAGVVAVDSIAFGGACGGAVASVDIMVTGACHWCSSATWASFKARRSSASGIKLWTDVTISTTSFTSASLSVVFSMCVSHSSTVEVIVSLARTKPCLAERRSIVEKLDSASSREVDLRPESTLLMAELAAKVTRHRSVKRFENCFFFYYACSAMFERDKGKSIQAQPWETAGRCSLH